VIVCHICNRQTHRQIKWNVEVIPEDLVILESCASNNNSSFNSSKYKALRMGPNQELIDNTNYLSGNGDSLVEEESPIKDLGVFQWEI
jgi:hypothetical protein